MLGMNVFKPGPKHCGSRVLLSCKIVRMDDGALRIENMCP